MKTSNITEKEYQHYVPKFYLRFFSNNDKSIGTYIFKNDKYIPVASLDGIGGYKFLYGEDGQIENWFCELEGKWNIILKKIINSNSLNISYEEYIYILMFIFLSEARNKTSAELANKFINELAVTIHNANLKNTDKYSYKDNIAHISIPNLHIIEVMPEIVPLLFDLNLVLVINQTNNQFITSDCIVSKYNQFLLKRNYKRGYGYGTSGIECFIPISSNHCLCLYDKHVYEAKVKKDIIIIKDPKEITKMNKLFLFNSDKNIFFNGNIEKNKIDVLLKNCTRIKIEENTVFKSEDGELLIKYGNRCINKNFDINFLKCNKKADKIKINLNASAPIRPYVQKLDEQKNRDTTSKKILDKIEGKKFYLEKKE